MSGGKKGCTVRSRQSGPVTTKAAARCGPVNERRRFGQVEPERRGALLWKLREGSLR